MAPRVSFGLSVAVAMEVESEEGRVYEWRFRVAIEAEVTYGGFPRTRIQHTALTCQHVQQQSLPLKLNRSLGPFVGCRSQLSTV